MPRLITSEMADSLLKVLVEEVSPGYVVKIENIELLKQVTKLDFGEIKLLLEGFADDRLIIELNVRQSVIFLGVTHKAHKLMEAGGFSGQLSMLKKQLELLEAELQGLPSAKAERTASIIASVLSIIQGLTSGLLGKY